MYFVHLVYDFIQVISCFHCGFGIIHYLCARNKKRMKIMKKKRILKVLGCLFLLGIIVAGGVFGGIHEQVILGMPSALGIFLLR